MRSIVEFAQSGTRDPAVSEREHRNRAVARRAAADGFVLLKNEGLLPLPSKAKIALFGSGARYTVKGGTGSGDVNEREVVNICQGLANADFPIVNTAWLEDYDERYRAARAAWKDYLFGDALKAAGGNFFGAYVKNPFFMPAGRPICAEDVQDAEAAVYVISRNAGEGADRTLTPGDYYLSEAEKADLRFLQEHGVATALLINAGGPVEITEISAWNNIRAILYIAQAGQEGGNAVADVLSGSVTPSGKLTAAWAQRYEDYPNAKSFSYLSGDVTKEYYTEGICVGYRYFDTFGIKPLYGFGYGLSYSTFAITGVTVSATDVTAEVVNTGEFAGRETVQVYVSCPRGRLPKERRRLVGFAKTRRLAPGEHERVCMSIPPKDLASFDEAVCAWVLEEGKYGIWVGNSLESAKLTAFLVTKTETLLETTAHICPLREPLEEIIPQNTALNDCDGLPVIPWEPVCEAVPACEEDGVDREAQELARKLPVQDLIPLLMGEIGANQDMIGSAGVRVPGSAGQTSGAFRESLGLAPVVLADGPAGLRLTKAYERDTKTGEFYVPGFLENVEHGLFAETKKHPGAETFYQYCTAMPVGVLLAQTFDRRLVEEVGRAVAKELDEFHVSWWLAPGMNIQRNPLCGRNFEYYSEDPVLSGCIAAAMVKGVQSQPGVGTTVKHFACNNQENNRIGSDSVISERTLREIYLRGFEIAVKESQPACLMTSYNLINGVHAANSYDLCTTAARKEWGFRGIIMTDWTTTAPEAGSVPHLCVKAGNDLIMPGMESDLKEIRQALETGALREDEIRMCACRLINAILRTNAYKVSE